VTRWSIERWTRELLVGTSVAVVTMAAVLLLWELTGVSYLHLFIAGGIVVIVIAAIHGQPE